MRVCVMGIDPGKEGAVAIMSNEPATFLYWTLDELDAREFSVLLKQHQVQHVYIEKAQAMPKQGVVSMFTYGMGFGRLIGWCEMAEVPFTLVTPQTWTKEVHKGCTGKKAKEKSQQAVKRLFPKEKCIPEGRRVPHIGVIDALLITEYGRRQYR